MRRGDEVASLVVEGEGALVGEEFVFRAHTTQCEDAGQLQLARHVSILVPQLLPLQLESQRGHVLSCLLDSGLDLLDVLVTEDSHDSSGLDNGAEDGES